MKYAIEIELSPLDEKPAFDISYVARQFWDRLLTIVTKSMTGTAVKKIIDYYYRFCDEDLSFYDNTITITFPESAGMCTLSSLISLHWTQLLLSINENEFNDFFKSMDWELKTKFRSVTEIQKDETDFYFEYKKNLFGISKRSGDGMPYLIYDEDNCLEFRNLSPDFQEKCLAFLTKRECQCPVCLKIAEGKLKPVIIKNTTQDIADKLINKGIELIKNGDNQKALELTNKALTYPDVDVYIYAVKAFALNNLKQYKEAIKCYKKYFENELGNAMWWCNFGICYRDMENTDESIKCYEKALERDPEYADAWLHLGYACNHKGDVAKALEYTKRSVEIDPSGPSYYNLACYHALLGNEDEALSALDRAIYEHDEKWRTDAKSDPDFNSIRKSKGFKDLMNGKRYGLKPEQAAESFIKILEVEIRKHELPYVGIDIDEMNGEEFDRMSGFIGGFPYLPKDYTFPNERYYNMHFFAQLNMSRVPKLPGFPEKGLLLFFLKDWNYPWDDSAVLYIPNSSENENDYKIFDAFKSATKGIYSISIRKEVEVSNPYPNDIQFDRIFNSLAAELDKNVRELVDELVFDLPRENAGHRIGGYAFFTQEDPRYKEKYSEYIQLLQVDELGEIDMMFWGDSGLGHFFIHPDDLEKYNFSKVLFHWDCY